MQEVSERKLGMLRHCNLPLLSLESVFSTDHLVSPGGRPCPKAARMLLRCGSCTVSAPHALRRLHLLQSSSIRVVGWHELGNMAQGGWTFLPDYPQLHAMLEHYSNRQ